MYLWVPNCPKCKTQNATSMGDPFDCTGIDVTGIKCRKCGYIIRPDGWADLKDYEKSEDFIDNGCCLLYYVRGE